MLNLKRSTARAFVVSVRVFGQAKIYESPPKVESTSIRNQLANFARESNPAYLNTKIPKPKPQHSTEQTHSNHNQGRRPEYWGSLHTYDMGQCCYFFRTNCATLTTYIRTDLQRREYFRLSTLTVF